MTVGREDPAGRPSGAPASDEESPAVVPSCGTRPSEARGDARPSMIAWRNLPESVRRVLGKLPNRFWCQVGVFHAKSPETLNLAEMIPVLDHVLDKAPDRLMNRVRIRAISPTSADICFRRVRDAINALREATQEVADLAGFRIDAWKAPALSARPDKRKSGEGRSARSGGVRKRISPASQESNTVKDVISRKLLRGEDVPQSTLVKNGLI